MPPVPADAAAGQSGRSVASGAGGAGPRRGGTCSVVAGGCAVVGGRVATAGGRPAELHAGRWRRARPRWSCSPCGHTVRPGWEGAQECRSPKPPCPDGSNGARARCLSSYAAALLAHLRPPRRAPLPRLPPPARAPPPGAPGWSLGLARCAGRRPPPPAPPPAEQRPAPSPATRGPPAGSGRRQQRLVPTAGVLPWQPSSVDLCRSCAATPPAAAPRDRRPRPPAGPAG